jgi:hypothetical protein
MPPGKRTHQQEEDFEKKEKEILRVPLEPSAIKQEYTAQRTGL